MKHSIPVEANTIWIPRPTSKGTNIIFIHEVLPELLVVQYEIVEQQEVSGSTRRRRVGFRYMQAIASLKIGYMELPTISASEAAARLGVTEQTVSNRIAGGKLRGWVVNRRIYVSEADVTATVALAGKVAQRVWDTVHSTETTPVPAQTETPQAVIEEVAKLVSLDLQTGPFAREIAESVAKSVADAVTTNVRFVENIAQLVAAKLGRLGLELKDVSKANGSYSPTPHA